MNHENMRAGVSTAPVSAPSNGGSYVEWTSILAGAVLAAALSMILLGFGAALGLSVTSTYEGESVSPMWVTLAAGVWFVWVMVTSYGAGGYLAGRMRRRFGDASAEEVETRDGLHGLMVWVTGALVGASLVGFGRRRRPGRRRRCGGSCRRNRE